MHVIACAFVLETVKTQLRLLLPTRLVRPLLLVLGRWMAARNWSEAGAGGLGSRRKARGAKLSSKKACCFVLWNGCCFKRNCRNGKYFWVAEVGYQLA